MPYFFCRFSLIFVALATLTACHSGIVMMSDGGDTSDVALPDDAGSDANAADSVDSDPVDGQRPDAGNIAPGCADPNDPTLTESEKLLLNLPADSWYSAPGTKLYDTCKNAATFGDGVYLIVGCTAIVSAWGGGAYDSWRQRMAVWGGGHADYGGNEVYAFDLKSMQWTQLTQPSRPPFNQDPLEDGNPVSRHTYDGVEFISHRGTMFAWGGSRSTDGNGTKLTWEFDFESRTWTNLSPQPPAISAAVDFGLAYDPVSQRVFLHAHAMLSSYDFDSNKWTLLMDFGYPPYNGIFDLWKPRTGAVDPKRRLFITAGSGMRMLVWDIDSGQVLSLDGPWSTVTGGETVLGRRAPGLDYDVAAEQIVAWSGGAPYALDADAKAWVPLSADGAPAEQTPNGTYSRWRYAERYNVFVLVNDAKQDVLFYKHTPLCGRGG